MKKGIRRYFIFLIVKDFDFVEPAFLYFFPLLDETYTVYFFAPLILFHETLPVVLLVALIFVTTALGTTNFSAVSLYIG